MKKSKLFILSFFITLGIAIYNGQFFKKDHLTRQIKTVPINKKWKTFEKTNQNTVTVNYSSLSDIKKSEVKSLIKRIPSSVEVTVKRKIMSNSNNIEIDQLEMINKVNPEWKEQLGNNLIKFQNKNTKVLIKTEGEYIKATSNTGQFLEQVLITYLFENGKSQSFRALVDSESSDILETWDRTQSENEYSKIPIKLPKLNDNGINGR